MEDMIINGLYIFIAGAFLSTLYLVKWAYELLLPVINSEYSMADEVGEKGFFFGMLSLAIFLLLSIASGLMNLVRM